MNVEIFRLNDLDDWEFYRIAKTSEAGAACIIGIRPYAEFGQVEYEIWDETGEEPRRAGSVHCDCSDEGRQEAVSRSVVNKIVCEFNIWR